MSAPAEIINLNEAIDILRCLQDDGIVDLGDAVSRVNAKKRKQILSSHPYPITQGKDGRYRSYVKTEGGKRRQIAKSTYEKVEDAIVDFYTGEAEEKSKDKVTLESLYSDWCEYKKLHGAASTYLKRIDSTWRNWYAGTEIIKKPILELDKFTLDIWAHELIEKTGHSKKKYYTASMPLRQILEYAVDRGVIESNPFSKVKIDSRQVFYPNKKKPSESQVFNRDELEELYAAALKHFEAGDMTVHKLAPLAILFQLQTGLRIGELTAVRYEDIEGDTIYVNRMFRPEEKEIVEYTKGRHGGRRIALTSKAKHIIETARLYQSEHNLDDTGYVFSVNDEPLSYYTVKKLYTKLCKEIDTVHKSSHAARRTFISALIDGGVNINTIREFVGHRDERTTYNSYCYDRSTNDERAKLIENALS